MKKNSPNLSDVFDKIQTADAIVVGVGAGLSTAAGLTYSGARFQQYFADFGEEYGITDIYSGAFYPFQTLEEQWGWWCRHIYYNRYLPEAYETYLELFALLKDKNYFILTTNADHQVLKAGFEKQRVFYVQGDYGLFQCSVPCKQETISNEIPIKAMLEQEKGRFIPTELLPYCKHCGEIMTPNLRKDNTFVEDKGWHEARQRYETFLREHQKKKVLFLELGVGYNTPSIIKYPFWQMTHQWEDGFFVSMNQEQPQKPKELKGKSMFFEDDLAALIHDLSSLQTSQ